MTRHAKALLVRLITTVLAVAGLALVTITTTPAAQAAPGDVGYADFQYGPGLTGGFIDPDNSPTASKPQSKLWFAQGTWWGVLQQPNTTNLSIWSFSPGTQSWTDTGVVVDNRGTGPKQADVLWDGTKLYIASAGRDGAATGIRVSRFRYDGSTYVLDGLQTTVNNGGVEAAVIAKDKTGRIWVAYTAGATPGRVVRVVASDAAQTTFSTPFSPPVDGTSVTTDDIATIVSHGDSVSVVWSNQTVDPMGKTAIYAARHPNSAAPNEGWIAAEKVLDGPSVADDHISLSGVEGNAAGSVFMIVKESADDPAHTNATGLVKLVVLRPTGVWESFVHSTVGDDMTRPIIALEPSKNLLHVYATSPVAGGVVYEKTTSMSAPSFSSGKGTAFIKLADHAFINNATSTKQNITDASGVLVLASDQRTGHYVHNYTPGSASPPPAKPVADFDYTPKTAGPAPFDVQFTDKSKEASSLSWNFGDGTAASTVKNPKHTFTKAGTYTVTLTATNYTGATSTKSVDITVKLPIPVASFTTTPTTGPAPLAVKFTDTSTGPATSWVWDFGDGGKSTVQNPTHTFAKAGTYTVKLTAINESGTSTKTGTVVVGVSVPQASFTWSPTTGTAPLAVKFTDTSTGPPSSWAWTFGDGGTSTQQSPTHTFAKSGTYTVSLKVTNASGTSTKTNTVVVAAVPVPTVALDTPTEAVTLSSYVNVAWHATTAPTTVKGYDVEVSSIGSGKGSTWATTVLANQTATAVQVPGMAGYSYCMRVRGTNTAGVVGAWSESRCTVLPLDDRSLSRKGSWRRASGSKYYMGTASISRKRGATLSKTVTGKQVYLLVNRRSGGGKVKVYEGKRLVKKVSLSARKARKGQQLITIASHSEDTTSRYRIVVKSSGKPVIIDGLAATR